MLDVEIRPVEMGHAICLQRGQAHCRESATCCLLFAIACGSDDEGREIANMIGGELSGRAAGWMLPDDAQVAPQQAVRHPDRGQRGAK